MNIELKIARFAILLINDSIQCHTHNDRKKTNLTTYWVKKTTFFHESRIPSMYFNALKQNLAKKEGMEQTYVVVCFKSLGHVLEPALCTTWEMKRRVRTPDSRLRPCTHSRTTT